MWVYIDTNVHKHSHSLSSCGAVFRPRGCPLTLILVRQQSMIGWQERRVAHQHKHCHLKLKSTSEKASLVSKILRQVIWLLLLTPSKLRIKLICAASNTAKKCLTEGFHAYSNKHFLQTVAFNYSLCYASLQGTHTVSRETKDWPSNILILLLLTNLCSTVTFVCY